MSEPEAKEIAGRIQMIDELLSDLQRRRKELVEAREALKEEISMSSSDTKKAEGSHDEEMMGMVLNSLQWTKFGAGKDGEWAFANRRDGRPLKELDLIRASIDGMRTGQQITVGDYRYKLSSDGKFLNRFSASARKVNSTLSSSS
jgi:hypothetical protein